MTGKRRRVTITLELSVPDEKPWTQARMDEIFGGVVVAAQAWARNRVDGVTVIDARVDAVSRKGAA